ncbi:MAG: saccharopine dehydrogenase NADP-binding domain-containing protein [Eubacteriales bacterium]|nr:saccharopine dehydrogenase NADP-binding domain-containing protein [Eubacteriales bacterium]
MIKKVLVLGVGAQGSAAAKKLEDEPAITEIVCADYDMNAVNNIVGELKKARGVKVDAHDVHSIISAAEGTDLVINALPLECTENVLEATLAVKANYQDYAGTTSLDRMWVDSELYDPDHEPAFEELAALKWWRSINAMYKLYGPRFSNIGKLAIFGTGSAPGLICAATNYSMRYLDTCDTIYNFVWEGAIAKRFQPFWWSPVTALNDMSEMAVAWEDGKFINTPAFGRDIKRQYDYMDEEITFREHCHDEPLHYGFNADTYFKGCRNAYFKYAGPGMDFCKPLYEAGLLSHEEEDFQGHKIVPFEFILSRIPHAPKYEEEIRSFVEEGMAVDSGCMVIESYGKKDGKDLLVEVHVNAPGFVESFVKAKMTGEMYLTGQSGYLYSKLFINGDLEGMAGVISSDMLSDEQVDRFFEYAAELDISLETKIKEL